MATIELHGRINEAGKLEVDLPDGLPVGEVKVTLEIAKVEDTLPQPDMEYLGWALYDAHSAARALQDFLNQEKAKKHE